MPQSSAVLQLWKMWASVQLERGAAQTPRHRPAPRRSRNEQNINAPPCTKLPQLPSGPMVSSGRGPVRCALRCTAPICLPRANELFIVPASCGWGRQTSVPRLASLLEPQTWGTGVGLGLVRVSLHALAQRCEASTSRRVTTPLESKGAVYLTGD